MTAANFRAEADRLRTRAAGMMQDARPTGGLQPWQEQFFDAMQTLADRLESAGEAAGRLESLPSATDVFRGRMPAHTRPFSEAPS